MGSVEGRRDVQHGGVLPAAIGLFCILLCAAGCIESRSTPAGAEEAGETASPRLSARSFTDVTAPAGLDGFRHENGAAGDKWFPEQMGAGGGFIDYDGDDWLDVVLVGGGLWEGRTQGRPQPQALRLYRNQGDGTFTETTAEAGLGGLATYGIGVAAADYDNDGDEDLFFTTLRENLLFRNDGGRFTEVGKAAGVGSDAFWSSSAVFFDADEDGWLDLYVGGYAVWSPEAEVRCAQYGQEREYCAPAVYEGQPSRFYRNNGDGTFTDRTREAGFLPAPGKSLGVAEMDFNHDGWSDLAVANDGQGDLLYRNNGDGTFSEEGVRSGFAFGEHGEARAGMGIDAGVVDTTGEVTLFVGNFSKEMIGVYRHIRGGMFINRDAVSKIGRASLLMLTFGLFLFDADLDGDLDLFVANGHVYPSVVHAQDGIAYRQPAQLFLNRGDGTFDEVDRSPGGPLAEPLVARAAAYGDYDRDGDLDVLVTENGGPAHLWRNEVRSGPGAAGPGVLRVRVEGRTSNREALGTRVVAVVGGRRFEQRIRTGSGYLSQSEKVATFGLGAASRVDSLTVYWPGGAVSAFAGVEGNREIRLVEGRERYTEIPLPVPPARVVARQ